LHCLEIDLLLAHANRQPIMLVEADPCGEREIRTHAHEHGPPVLVVQIEVILIHPALFVFQMRVIVVLSSDRHQNTGWFPSFQDDGNAVGSGVFQIRQNEIVAPLFLRRVNNGRAPFFRPVLHPIQKLVGNFRQTVVRYSLAVALKKPSTRSGC